MLASLTAVVLVFGTPAAPIPVPPAAAACVSCHGEKSLGKAAMGAPALAGQHEAYLLKQLLRYQKGQLAKGPAGATAQMMTGFVAALDEATLRQLARYYSKLPAPAAKPAKADPAAALYLQNCGSCHGREAEGNQALATPGLRRLSKTFLSNQMARYRSPGLLDQDPQGASMSLAVKPLSEAKLKAIIDWLARL
ncbi:MAG: hypothetical protein CMH55_05645 [Myxococcales bacterium]|nr:hypothetical protein [Myxococcales bacterium]